MVRKQPPLQRLRRITVFRRLSSGELKTLLGSAVSRYVRPGEVLYEQGETASGFFVLLHGTVRFCAKLGTKTTTVGLAFTNDLFGLESLSERVKRTETATAVSAAEVLEVDSDVVKQAVSENPEFRSALLGYLVGKLNEQSAHAVRIGHYDAEQRIAAYLIKQAGPRSAGKRRSRWMLSQADVADYLGLTPETFCRKVNKFRRLGWIEGSGNEYVVKRRDALRELLER